MPDTDFAAHRFDEGDDRLICPAGEIFDSEAVAGAIAAGMDEAAGDAGRMRAAAVSVLRDALAVGRARIQTAFEAQPFAGHPVVRAHAWLTDAVLRAVHDTATRHLHPVQINTTGERLAVLAVGGYGRFEMAPHSDVDLLFLSPYKLTGWAESVIESILYMLWDLRLKVGHAARTVEDCLRLGREDLTIRTAMLETRAICGDRDLARELDDQLWAHLFKGTEAEFIEGKLAEREKRHQKQGQRYVVEPNVKEGKGGLRDLQTMFWVAKYTHRVTHIRELVEHGVFTAEEYETFRRADEFLWAVRSHLHLVTNRAMDQLTFDLQVEVAARMGYKDSAGRRAVEHFMQEYFRHATKVGDLTRILLTALEGQHLKRAPKLFRLFKRRRMVRAPFVERQGRLAVADEAAFLADKLNMLRLFEEGLRTGVHLHPDAMRLVAAHLELIDDELRNNREAARIFLDLLLKHGNPERALRRMNELGVLAAYIPEFEPIVAMMQFNMYHAYTVDEHTIQCITALAEIERGERAEELQVSTEILRAGVNRRVLYLAVFCHDIGKGRVEDHSILGAKLARPICTRLGFTKEEIATVEWLVRSHLLLSDVAQKRDLSDPRTVNAFAKAVGTRKRLDLLLVLTVCDIRGVGPTTWNNWKATLFRDLYRLTRQALEGGIEALSTGARASEARKALRAALPDWDSKALHRETRRHGDPYWQGLQTADHVIFANLLKGISEDEIRISLSADPDRDATRASFALADHPGIFSRLAGALALVGANVVDARTYTTRDGWATPVFWVQDREGKPYDEGKLPRLRTMIDKTLKGEVVASEAMRQRDRLKKRERAFKVPTQVIFDNEGSEIYTIIEVDTRDRPGLLYDLTRCLAANNVQIASAVIATYGEQVVDTFYVTDMFGLKFHSEARLETLDMKLREAIQRGAERALD
ncbi:MAG: [protein-PII] uridylyltransferase [Rhodobacterales bacterium]|nr:MAG: [protein-PII] uridylyltransferase [Rhodobacterales bacterium]